MKRRKKRNPLVEFAEDAKPTRAKLEAASTKEAYERRAAFLEAECEAHEAELIKDILRVADAEWNTHKGTCSRARYKKFGWFPESVIFDFFGNHQEFQRAAGLRDHRTTSKFRDKRARLKTEERIAKYIKATVMPWAGAFDRKHTNDFNLLVGSDFHGEECDPFALAVFIDTAKRIQPETIVLNGDIVDFVEVARWSKNPRRLLDLQREIDFTRKHILEAIREAAPEAQIDLVIGNHEYRLIRYLADTAPELASLRCLDFSELFGLKELRINIVLNDAQLAPDEKDKRQVPRQSWKVYGGCFVVTHGTKAGKFPAEKELSRFGLSGCSGHVHRPQYHSLPTLSNPNADWFTTGMMAKNEVADGEGHGANFKQGPSSWSVGFALVSIFSNEGIAIPQPVLFKNGITTVAGKTYREGK